MTVSLLPQTTTTMWSILKPHQLLALVLVAAASEDFDWTKNQQTSFYYGTFPTGRTHRSAVVEQRLLFFHLSVPLQGSPGELAAPPIRPKEPGTLMGKEGASGTHLPTKRAESMQTTQETFPAKATINLR